MDNETLGLAMMLIKLGIIDQVVDARPLRFVFTGLALEVKDGRAD